MVRRFSSSDLAAKRPVSASRTLGEPQISRGTAQTRVPAPRVRDTPTGLRREQACSGRRPSGRVLQRRGPGSSVTSLPAAAVTATRPASVLCECGSRRSRELAQAPRAAHRLVRRTRVSRWLSPWDHFRHQAGERHQAGPPSLPGGASVGTHQRFGSQAGGAREGEAEDAPG